MAPELRTHEKRLRNPVPELKVGPALQQLVRERLDLVVFERETLLDALLNVGRLDLVPSLEFPPSEDLKVLSSAMTASGSGRACVARRCTHERDDVDVLLVLAQDVVHQVEAVQTEEIPLDVLVRRHLQVAISVSRPSPRSYARDQQEN